jgi:hypothetical protein
MIYLIQVLISPCLYMVSNKVSHAENQQERLIMTGWVLGFVDGEGCFSLGLVK